MEIKENFFESERHKSFYLSCGPEDGELIIMTHGWPELSLSWRHQLKFLGDIGYFAIAPDMRGYGRSSIYEDHRAYSQELVNKDMLELFDSLGREKAIWIGHDWGSPVAWNMALHHPEKVKAVCSLCVPYGFGSHPDNLADSVNREIYPEEEYPVGQWDYQLYYYENFDAAQREMDEDPFKLIKILFRKGDPMGQGLPAATSSTRKNKGWFSELGGIPDFPIDEDVISEEEAKIFASHLQKNSFFGPNSWYVNGDENQKFNELKDDHSLNMPSLFVHATYDYVCDTTSSPKFAQPMRELCKNLTEERIDCGHWMAQEKPEELNKILGKWLKSI